MTPEERETASAPAVVDLPLAVALPEARVRFRSFLDGCAADARVVVFCHFDADGLGAGAVLGRALPRLGFTRVQVLSAGRGESAFSTGARERLLRTEPDALIVTDLGVHRDGVLSGVPTAYIDHHQPSGYPAGACVITGYGWTPVPASAWLAFELLRDAADIEDLAWIAAIGTISDLGDKAPWDALPEIRKRFSGKWLKEAVVLINAARRASAFDIETPLRLLLQAQHPREISDPATPGAALLAAYRAEVHAELLEARRHAPRFSTTGPYALVSLHSPCQVHPLIAQQWRSRLPKYAVIAANTGYLRDIVAFSMRTARTDLNLPALLQSIELRDFDGRFGYGHDQASGGHLPPEAFAELLNQLGFPAV